MNSPPSDQADRDRFTRDWAVNLAVVANAGSGKTTAISERLAAMALASQGAELLGRTAVVTYTKKAAAQIGQRARSVLLRRLPSSGTPDLDPLARLDRAFFGTIHSFCILLARRHGSALGVHLNPVLVEDEDGAPWEEFVDQDPMQFGSLSAAQVAAFLRHAPLDDIFGLAQELNLAEARRLAAVTVAASPPGPSAAALADILNAGSRGRGAPSPNLRRNQETAQAWFQSFGAGAGRLPIPKPEGTAAGITDLYRRFFAPLKGWLAAAGGVLAAELALRYRAWRLDRGIQTYADQVDTAVEVLADPAMLERIRAENWRVILDEAQDTDPSQFEVLVEITRAPGSQRGTWPGLGGPGPRPGHFCMVGDAQQGIYSSRADIRNFQNHVSAFARGEGGERLTFDVTFRTPRRVVRLLNKTLPPVFGPARAFSFGVPPADGAPEPFLQVGYEPLVAGPLNAEGGAWVLPVAPAAILGTKQVADRKLADEARQVARLLAAGGPPAVGARNWGEICILAPRRAWLPIVRGEFEAAGLKTALQMRRNRNGDNPAYAWLCGLLAVICDPENGFEWVGVLREVFAVSDGLMAEALPEGGRIEWDEPGDYPAPIRAALEVLGPFIGRADLEGDSLGRFAAELAAACRLAPKARRIDPDGAVEDELARLLARAAELGLGGAGPRAWLRELLGAIDEFRASGRAAPDAINMITSHSAKGLEWPVVIPLGLWREIVSREPRGLRIVAEWGGLSRVVFDNEGLGPETRESNERARLRELVRLLYVVLTRSKAALVIPWSAAQAPEKNSFATLWGFDPSWLDPLPLPAAEAAEPAEPEGSLQAPEALPDEPSSGPAPGFPARILPHELARAPDLPRAARHEASLDLPSPARDGADPLDYGVWWHEMLEFVPWAGDEAAVSAHAAAAVDRAGEKGFQDRAAAEWERFRASEPWHLLRNPRWTALAEVGVFAPLESGWIDGVIDLVLHDPLAAEVWIVDWKTNQRGAGESDEALLGRLAAEYQGQLAAYGTCTAGFFPTCKVRLWVYSTAAGAWTEVGAAS